MRIVRQLKEYTAGIWTLFCVGIVLLLPLFLFIGIAFKAIPIFDHVSLSELLFSSVGFRADHSHRDAQRSRRPAPRGARGACRAESERHR